jgi:hypothetical protein
MLKSNESVDEEVGMEEIGTIKNFDKQKQQTTQHKQKLKQK